MGLSSSPSNTLPPYDRARFPGVTLYDNVMCQQRLVSERFGIQRIAMVVGFSMGAQQTFQWGSLFPEMVERILPVCGSAKTSHHNFVFLEGVKAALTADDAWKGGEYEKPPTKGLRAMARVYAGWAVSQAFYREEVYLRIGYSSLEDYLREFWEGRRLDSDANEPAGNALDLATGRRQRQPDLWRRFSRKLWAQLRPRRLSCHVRRTCISRPRTMN